ncbi:hypothetical protein M0R19_03220 [Candidatus Pacearchaeota archaeon]|nr:hypothetical protein [Candidatus Pacearchaeota archaeon]
MTPNSLFNILYPYSSKNAIVPKQLEDGSLEYRFNLAGTPLEDIKVTCGEGRFEVLSKDKHYSAYLDDTQDIKYLVFDMKAEYKLGILIITIPTKLPDIRLIPVKLITE